MTYFRKLAFLFLISCASVNLSAQSTNTSAVQGEVRLKSGSPVPRAIVSAYLLAGDKSGYTANIVSPTTNDGMFRINLAYGNYIFLVTKDNRRLYQGAVAISAPRVENLTLIVNDPTCTPPIRIYERTYLQVADSRFHDELFIYVGDIHRTSITGIKSWLYIIVGPNALPPPDPVTHSARFAPATFTKLQPKVSSRLEFYKGGEHLDFDYGQDKYRLSIENIIHDIGKDKQSVIVDICSEQ